MDVQQANENRQRVRHLLSDRLQGFLITMRQVFPVDAEAILQRAEHQVTVRGPDNNWHHIDL
jgi:hypothetical protein